MRKLDIRSTFGKIPHRWTFLSANALIVLAVWIVGIQPMVDVFADQARDLDAARHLGDAYRSTIQDGPSLAKAEADLAPSMGKAFVRGKSEGALKAALQREIQTLAEGAGMRIASIRAVEPRKKNSIWFLGAHIELSGTIAAQRLFLRMTEAHRPLLLVENVGFRIPAQVAGGVMEPSVDGQYQIYEPALDYAPAH